MNPEEKSSAFLLKRLERLRLKTKDLFPLMRGSVVKIGMKNKRPTYSLNMNGKTKIISLGHGKNIVAERLIHNYHSLQSIIDEMTLINIELIRRVEFTKKNPD